MKQIILVFFAFTLLTITACKKKEDDIITNPNELKQTVKLHGNVVDENMQPVNGAIIQFNGKTFITNQGFYVFDDVTINSGRQVVTATKSGYFNAVVGFEATASTSAQVQIVLVQKTLSGTIDATTGGTVTTGTAEVTLAANGLEDDGGNPFTGTANLYTFNYKTSDANFSAEIPGGDLNARTMGGAEKQLLSYGMLGVKMDDGSGTPLQIAAGQTANIKLPIAAAQLANAPATIKFWHLDETTGIWQEEGSATKSGSFYTGTVTHFSTWNIDSASDVATIIGTVVDCNGNPLPDAFVSIVDGTPGNGNPPLNSMQVQESGKFKVKVPAGFPIKISVTPFGGSATFINVPALAPGDVYDIGTITSACGTKVTARLVDANGFPVRSMVRIEKGNQYANVDVWNGQMSIVLGGGGSYTIRPYCMQGVVFGNAVNINTPSSPGTIDQGDIPTCPATGGGGGTGTDLSLDSFTVNGGGYVNEQFHFSSGTGAATVNADNYQFGCTGIRQGNGDNISITVFVYDTLRLGYDGYSYALSNVEQPDNAKVIISVSDQAGTYYKIFTSISGQFSAGSNPGTVGHALSAFFYGTFQMQDFLAGTTQTVTITTGSVSATRFQ